MKKNVGNVQSSQGIRNNQQLKNVQSAYGQKPSSSSNAHNNAINKPGSSSSNSKTPTALGNNNNSNFVEEKRRPQTNSERLKNNQGLHGDSVQHRKVNNAQSASSLSHIEKKDEHSGGQHYLHEMGLESGEVEDVIRELSNEEDELIKMISQHLTTKHCPQTAQMFIQEIYQPTNPHNQQTLLMHAITKAFEQGNRDLFFGKWVKLPHQPAQNPQVIDKLEFYLQIYFLIYEIHPLFKTKEAISSDRIEYFREYLESKGSELSKTTELLSFYALPYVPKPSEHPGFKQLFTKDWVIDLRQKLTAALEKLTRDNSTLTDLEQIYYASKRGLQEQQIQEQQQYPQPYIIAQGNNLNRDDPQQHQLQQPQQQNNFPDNSYIVDNSALRANNVQYLTVLEELNQRYYNLHKVYVQVQDQAKQAIMDSHHKWFKIGQDLVHLSQDLIQMVEAAANGVPPQISVFESKKKKLSQFEHFLSSNIEDLVHQSQDISLFEKQVSIIEYDQSPILNQYKQQSHILQFDQSVPRTYGNNYDNPNNGVRKLQMQNNSGQYDQQYNLNGQGGVAYGVDGQQQVQQQQHIQQQQQQQHQQLMYQQQQQQYEDQSYAPIDFNKIKQVLKSDQTNPDHKTTILQALRWRIAKTRSAYQRREVIISYTLNDILGCLSQDNVLQQAIFNSDNLKLTECGLRLVNALASDFQGRTYLVASEALVKLLIAILWKEQEDSSTRRNALGALQKLSLRKKSQLVMIQNDLIKWIVETLRNEKDELSEYSYEYATALFMNLSLRQLGRDKCEDPNLHVIEVLQRLLEHDSQQVRTFVNGTLYSLLGRPALREQSRQLSLQQYLIHLRENSEERFHNQLSYIIEQLQKDEDDYDDEDNNSNLGEGHEDEDNDEDDIEDEEIDEEEDEEDEDEEEEDAADEYNLGDNQDGQRINSMIGENLLIQQFSLRGPEALRQRNMTRTALEESKRNAHNQSVINQSRISSNNKPEPFNRPATPSLSISQISHSQIPGYHQENKQKLHNNQINNKQNNNQVNNTKQNSGQVQMKNNNEIDQQQQDQDQYQLGEVHRQQQQKQLGSQQQQQQQQQSVQSAGQSQSKGGFVQNEQQNQTNSNGNSVSSLNKARAVQQQQQQQQVQQQPYKQQQNQQQQQSSSSAVQSTEQKNTKEAFAPRPKIPRTPPTKDEGEEEEE